MNTARSIVLWMLLPMSVWVAHFLALYIGATLACSFGPETQAPTQLRWIGAAVTLIAILAIGLAVRRRAVAHAHAHAQATSVPVFLRRMEQMLAALAVLAIGLNALMLITAHPCA